MYTEAGVRQRSGEEVRVCARKEDTCSRTKKHKESRAGCVGQNYIHGTDEVCSVREGVVCGQDPATNLTGNDPF